MHIRVPTDDELDAVGNLVRSVYVGDGYIDADGEYQATVADARARVGQAETLVAVDDADSDQQLLGTLVFCPPGSTMRELAGDGEAEFRMLAVAPAARGRGVGTALVRACIDRARRLGLARLVLWTMPVMVDAQRLYTGLGFRRLPARDLTDPALPLHAFGIDL